VKFVATKKCLTKILFSPLSFLPVFGSGIRDPGSGMGKNQDPGSGINIPDPQHCKKGKFFPSSLLFLLDPGSESWDGKLSGTLINISNL
jgi:hypothetical protein